MTLKKTIIMTVNVMREYGSEFDFIKSDKTIKNCWNNYKYFNVLRCGRDSVLATAKVLLKERGINTIWVPALSCHSMYEGFVFAGYKIKFYPVNESFNPVLDNRENFKNSAVLFMLYYGVTDNGIIERFIQEHQESVSIIDITHSLWSEETYKLSADILIGSIRKNIGVVNGGIFLSDKFYIDIIDSPNKFTILREKAFKIKKDYNSTLNPEKKQEYRDLFYEAEASLDKERGIYSAEPGSIETIMSLNIADIKYKRLRNFNALYKQLCEIDSLNILVHGLKDNETPFSLPVLIDNQLDLIDNQLEFQKKLAKLGVYAPVLWPISDEAKQICQFSKYVSEHMLSLPIDQRYSTEDMYEIAERVKQAIYEK